MPLVASVPCWFLAGKYALENSSIVFLCAALDVFAFEVRERNP